MKKMFVIISALVLCLQLQAQDLTLLNRIKTANGKIKSFDADLANTMIKSNKTLHQEGKIYFVAPNEFTAQFTTGKFIIVNEKRMKMDIGIFHGTFKLKDGGMMRSLSHIFLYGFQGRVQDLAEENNYSLTTQTQDGCHIVTATTKKKNLFGIGYKQVIIKYHEDNLMFKEVILYDYSGNKDTYTISNVNVDVEIDKNMFQF